MFAESIFDARRKPWNGLGTNVQGAVTSEEAIKLAGLDWEVEKRPIYVDDKELKGYKATVRSTDGRVLGLVTDRYKVVQNKEAFEFTDTLLAEDKRIFYETAGSLNGGKRVWMLAKMPTVQILGDDTEPYLVFTNSHDGKGSIRVAITPIRVWCQNTLNLALKNANRAWSTKHIGNIEEKIAEAHRTLELAGTYLDNLKEQAEILADKNINKKQVAEFIDELLPMPKIAKDEELSERKKNAILESREELMARYLNAPDLSRFRNTGWGVISAVSDYATHSNPRRATSSFRENLFAKTVDGHPLIDKAYELLKVA